MVTNRYLQHHDDKTTLNTEIQRAEAAKTYWKTREFDPISVKLVDEEREKKFIEDRSEKAKIHGKDQVKKLPITVQK